MRDTEDAVVVGFAVPPELRAAYAFVPGQYLTLRTVIDGEEQRRSYSICSGPDEAELRIGVKRVEGGLVSVWANAALQPGMVVEVMTPTGRFGVPPGAAPGHVFAGFASGSGITPILSILRGILAGDAASRFFLFYGNRTTTDVMFRTALDALKDRYLDRLSVFHVLSREEQDVPVLNGRLDAAKIRLLLTRLVPAASVDHAFVCGPEGMAEEVAATLAELGLAPAQVHVERFVSALGGRPRVVVPPPADAPPHATATLIVEGQRREIRLAEGEAVLDAALRAGLDLPYACKGGMCCTCRARLVSGTVTMALNYSLEPWEVAAGFVLTCQARPTSPAVVIDYDQM